MNNYANWEITQLLPIKSFMETDYFISKDNSITHKSAFEHFKADFELIPYYTWEDIRLYLESKGYSININHYVLQDIPYWCHVVNSIDRNSQDIGKFDTYEQAREEAIKWCLTKINL